MRYFRNILAGCIHNRGGGGFVMAKYSMKSNKERPLFNYLVKDSIRPDYYLFDEFDDAIIQALNMFKSEGRIINIYENHLDPKTLEWRVKFAFFIYEGEIMRFIEEVIDAHVEYFVNAGEWLNPNEKWIEILNNKQLKDSFEGGE